jgi:zinc D-Ala-D-Ala carboxypeptidase
MQIAAKYRPYIIAAAILIGAVLLFYLIRYIMVRRHFSFDEFDSKKGPQDTGETYIKNGYVYLKNSGRSNMDLPFLIALGRARDIAGFPFTITSGYRSPSYNGTVPNSVTGSAHTLGYAADIAVSNENKLKLAISLIQAGFNRIGWMNSALHVDNDPNKPQNVVWGYPDSVAPYTFEQLKAMAA